jgi:hypothetical protein
MGLNIDLRHGRWYECFNKNTEKVHPLIVLPHKPNDKCEKCNGRGCIDNTIICSECYPNLYKELYG